MEEEIREVKVYTVGDTEFFNQEEAKAYENRLIKGLQYVYYKVGIHTLAEQSINSLLESNETIIGVKNIGDPLNLLYNYLIRRYGMPIQTDGLITYQKYDVKEILRFETEELEEEIQVKNLKKLDSFYLKNISLDIIEETGEAFRWVKGIYRRIRVPSNLERV